MQAATKWIGTLLLIGALVYLGLEIQRRIRAAAALEAEAPAARGPAPVEVAPIERGAIALRRTFSGELASRSRFLLSPKVGGRVERVGVDIGDPVQRGEIVVWLDDDEAVQAVAQADAELAVARANEVEARSVLEIAGRELARVESLQNSGVSSASQLDAARAEELAATARLAVTSAQVKRAESALTSAEIRLSYTRVAAAWSEGDAQRIVAERYVDEGETVGANTPLLSIVDADPIQAVLFVPERDYARLRTGQPAVVETQAWPGERFTGSIARIAPVFRETTRQARVELAIPNADQRLKPGMFVRATIELVRVEDALLVPEAALTERADQTGVFVVAEDGRAVRWRPVTVGVRDGGRAQVEGEGLIGRVVTLGHQLVDDGALITIPGEDDPVLAAEPRG